MQQPKLQTQQQARINQRVIIEGDIDIAVITCKGVFLATLFTNCNVLLPVHEGWELVATCKNKNGVVHFDQFISDASKVWIVK